MGIMAKAERLPKKRWGTPLAISSASMRCSPDIARFWKKSITWFSSLYEAR